MLVIVDTREKNTPNANRIIEKLRINGVSIEFASLICGDYFIPPSENKKGFIVERKTIFDFINAVKTRRLFEQLKNLCSCEEEPLIVVEGSPAMIKKFSEFSDESLIGVVFSCIYDFGVKVLFVPSYYWTYLIIRHLVRRAQISEKIKYRSLKTKKLPKTPEEQAIFFLSSLPGVSEVRAKQILRVFGTPLEALNKYRSWKVISGIGDSIVENVGKVLTCNFKGKKK